MFKTFEDVERVARAGKPEHVLDMFVESYLRGEALRALYRVTLVEGEVETGDAGGAGETAGADGVGATGETAGAEGVRGAGPDAVASIDEAAFRAWLAERMQGETFAPPELATTEVEAFKRAHYAMFREGAYGTWEQQLDMQYHGTWQAHMEAVKAAWPKPENVPEQNTLAEAGA
ncbi:hypothetical protein GGQ74_000323 [Desulfobaculum xiamenense]|uniref:Uncharacterized protein n=1 Tax=Desulfobaculum xiamenense TaxID=995050 RepID=A0A846QKH2_9BACT|nr:hypothetical protein [Desulfobaculum xiamenense]NJB66683.1 hypothetical protein [Desulfobaculum xiamenense]